MSDSNLVRRRFPGRVCLGLRLLRAAAPEQRTPQAALVITQCVSAAAVTYAAVFPKANWSRAGNLVIARSLPTWAYPRGGVCIGRVFLTGSSPSLAVLDHEKRHVAQWETYGWRFPFLYAMAGRDPQQNRFEVEAGLAEGGYL